MYPYGRFLSRKTITFDDSTGTIPVFTVTGAVFVRVAAICTTEIVGASAMTGDLGTAASPGCLIGSCLFESGLAGTVIADDGGAYWYETPCNSTLWPLATTDRVISDDVVLSLSDQVASGEIEILCFWTPFSADGAVSDVVDDRIDAALPDAAPGAAGGLFIAGTNAATKISTASGHAFECVTTEADKHGVYAKGGGGLAYGLYAEGNYAGIGGGGQVGVAAYGSLRGVEAMGTYDAGIVAKSNDTGAGVKVIGGTTSGDGISITTTYGDGVKITASGSGKVDINADLPKVDLVDAPNATALGAIKDAVQGAGTTLATLLSRIVGTLATGTHQPQSGDTYTKIGTVAVTVTSPVATDGTLTIYQGDDYAATEGRELAFDVTDASHLLGLDDAAAEAKLKLTQATWTATSITSTATGYTVVFEPDATDTAALTSRRQSYELELTTAAGSTVTAATGTATVVADIPEIAP